MPLTNGRTLAIYHSRYCKTLLLCAHTVLRKDYGCSVVKNYGVRWFKIHWKYGNAQVGRMYEGGADRHKHARQVKAVKASGTHHRPYHVTSLAEHHQACLPSFVLCDLTFSFSPLHLSFVIWRYWSGSFPDTGSHDPRKQTQIFAESHDVRDMKKHSRMQTLQALHSGKGLSSRVHVFYCSHYPILMSNRYILNMGCVISSKADEMFLHYFLNSKI